MNYPAILALLNQMEEQLKTIETSLNSMKQIIAGEEAWSQEEEDDYRMRHSS